MFLVMKFGSKCFATLLKPVALLNETLKSHKMNQFYPWLGFKPVTVILFYSVLHMSGIYQRVSWKLNGCRSTFTLLQLLWSCFMNWTGMTLSGKTNKLNVLQNWKKSGTINSGIITHTVQLLLFRRKLKIHIQHNAKVQGSIFDKLLGFWILMLSNSGLSVWYIISIESKTTVRNRKNL